MAVVQTKKLNTLNMKKIRDFIKLANNVIHVKTVHDYVTMTEQFNNSGCIISRWLQFYRRRKSECIILTKLKTTKSLPACNQN